VSNLPPQGSADPSPVLPPSGDPHPPPGQSSSWLPSSQQPLRATPARGSRNPIVIGGVIAAVVVLGAAAGCGSSTPAPDAQVRAAVKQIDDDMNSADAMGLMNLTCMQERNSASFQPWTAAALTNEKDTHGTRTSTVTAVQINGDHATADVNITWSKSPTKNESQVEKFFHESDSWKLCNVD
jgi:hypothetical protein